MTALRLQFSADTALSLPKRDFTDAVLANGEALGALFKAMRDDDLTSENAARCAVTIDAWEVVMPLISEAYREHSGAWDAEVGHAWADSHLPKTAPLKEGERRRHKTLVLDYEGPPKVKLALELLWHWCEYLVGAEEGQKLFTKLCEALNAHFKLHF